MGRKKVIVFDIDDTIIGLLAETFHVLNIPMERLNDLIDYRVNRDPFWKQYNLGDNLERLLDTWRNPETYLNSAVNAGYEKINTLSVMGNTIIFHSMCLNEETAYTKKQIIHRLYPWTTEDNFKMDINVKKALDIKPDYFVENDVLFLNESGAKTKVLIDFSYNRPINTGMPDDQYGIHRVKDLSSAVDFIINDINKNTGGRDMTQQEICNYLINKISKYLPKRDYAYMPVYGGRSLEIVSKASLKEDYQGDRIDETRFYIRIVLLGANRYAVDMSNITLDPSKRGKGLFRTIITDLKNSRKPGVCEIWVSSVLTSEMHRACRALGMDRCESISGYKYIIKS